MASKLLGIDVGTGGTRAVILDDKGAVLISRTAEHVPFASPQTGWAEQDPHDWWRACGKAMQASHRRLGHSGRGDCGRRLLRPDARRGAARQRGRSIAAGADLVRSAHRRRSARTDRLNVGEAQMIAWTCNPALTNFTLTKLLWVRKHEPKLFERFRTLLLPKDYVRYRLTGEFGMDMADASGTLLLDVANRRWSAEMADAAGIDISLLFLRCSNRPMFAAEFPRRARRRQVCGKALQLWPARAIRLRAQWDWASSCPEPCTPPSEPQASSSRRPIVRRWIPTGGCTPSVTRSLAAGTSWA